MFSVSKVEARIAEIDARLAEIDSELADLAEADELTDEQREAAKAAEVEVDALLEETKDLRDRKAELEARDAARAEVRRVVEEGRAVREPEAPQVMRKVESRIDSRTADRGERRDAALATLEERGADYNLSSDSLDQVERMIRAHKRDVDTGEVIFDGDKVARGLIATENPAYRSAFVKGVTQSNPAFTAEEVDALEEYRAASLTTTAGGFGVPVLIDPTIIITSASADVPILRIARVESITNNVWKGVSSAGVSWSFDGEAAEVSDDAATLAQPTVTAHKAQGFIPYSIEIGGDYPGFAMEMSKLLSQGYQDLLAEKLVNGTGTIEPFGIVTALDANTNVEVVTDTDGAINPEDLLDAWKSLPEQYRSRASWLMNVDVENEIRAFSSSSEGAYYTVNLTQGGVGQLFGRPVYLTDNMPEFTNTTGAENLLIVGDFQNYLVAQRVGMTVELVPQLFATANNLPSGQRGWYAWARVGGDSVNDLGFRLLQNQ